MVCPVGHLYRSRTVIHLPRLRAPNVRGNCDSGARVGALDVSANLIRFATSKNRPTNLRKPRCKSFSHAVAIPLGSSQEGVCKGRRRPRRCLTGQVIRTTNQTIMKGPQFTVSVKVVRTSHKCSFRALRAKRSCDDYAPLRQSARPRSGDTAADPVETADPMLNLLSELVRPIEPIDDHAIAVYSVRRQWMAITLVNVKRVYLPLFLKRFRHSERLSYRNHCVGPAM